MLSLMTIETAVKKVAPYYPVKSVRLFGSYANGNAEEHSDVDVMVEFTERPVTLLDYCGFQQDLSDDLNTPVDIVVYPLSEQTKDNLDIGKVISLYEK